MGKLGNVEEVNLREQWKNEQYDFTPWLSENLGLLEDVIGLDLEVKGTEVSVGKYNADIVAQPTSSEAGDVVIENQLGKSDHDHLGKVITYASGLDASYIVWICEKIQEEHKAAVDWLNENLSRDTGIIALEIKLLKIDNSNPAPQFKVISEPEEWSKYVKSATTGELTETKQLQREFWSKLKEHMEEKGSPLNPRKPRPQHWYDFSTGSRNFIIRLVVDTRKKEVRCELYIRKDGTDYIRKLKGMKKDLEEDLEGDLDWQPLEEKDASRIVQYKDFDVKTKGDWYEAIQWCKKKAEKFYEVFKPRIQNLD